MPARAEPRNALGEVQDVMYRAWEEPSRARRMTLARRALEISPDCADAYVLLAEDAPSTAESEALYSAGCAAGERALGPEAFRDDAGRFWGILETRPYMRARLGLGTCLWTSGRHDDAIAHYREMLRLNVGDNQGVRYLLASALCELRRDSDLHELLNGPEYRDEATAAWLYTRALLAFRREGDGPGARKALRAARGLIHHA
jgi:tetratricopeptide (TPR) repeat protein